MERRTAVVTGATGGIGRWIALGLARSGCRVVLVGRDRARGEAAQDWIRGQAPGAELDLMVADLSSLAATRALGGEIAARHPRLAVLVNNAGVFRARRDRTDEGHDVVLATNHLSPFVLTRALEGALRAGAPSRIVAVGSSTSDRARIDPANLELERGWGMVRAYGQSKLALMMTTFEWARRLDGTGVTFAELEHASAVLLVCLEPEEEAGVLFLRLRKGYRKHGLAVHTLAPYRTTGAAKLDAGLIPTVPVKAAGWRIEPPVSVPVAPRHRSAATAAADPPDDPPGVSRRSSTFHGLTALP